VTIATINLGASVNNSTPTVLQWAVAANSNAVSLATGAPSPPIRVPIGIQSIAKGSVSGDAYSPGVLVYNPRTPLVIFPGRYLHVIVRVPVGVATTHQTVRGTCTIEGYFE
jgi:hypothetical protein